MPMKERASGWAQASWQRFWRPRVALGRQDHPPRPAAPDAGSGPREDAAAASVLPRWRQAARLLRRDALPLYYAVRHPGTPWPAKAVAAAVVAYAFSPLDLIPDCIPVLGLLDDLILVPLGVGLALRLVPPPVLAECRQRAQATLDRARPRIWAAAAVIISLWVLLALLAARLLLVLAHRI